MAENYNLEMERVISALPKGQKPTLLLHSCCAPCSSACIERLKDIFDITIYYYNPNLDSEQEYLLRSTEQVRLAQELGVKVIIDDYNQEEFLTAVKGHETSKEGGSRCGICFALRLDKTAKKAKQDGYDFFTTTLTISPLKNAERLNGIGYLAGERNGAKWLASDFKKKGGYLRSIELSKKYDLYRQNYCGCIFSKNALPKD
jgi:predicted adenine nucleotide alpha hydrolase (AANH) superfamily ATPase